MASYIQVPRDLSKIKTKVLFGLTKRQLLSFSAAALLGVPFYFLIKHFGNNTLAMTGMILIMLPFFVLAMYEKDGAPLEVVMRHIVEACFLRPKQRPYRTNNYYSVLEKQAMVNREVEAIVQKRSKTVPEE